MITTAIVTIMSANPTVAPIIIRVPDRSSRIVPITEIYVPRNNSKYYNNYDRNHYYNYDFKYPSYDYGSGFGMGFGAGFGTGFGAGFGNGFGIE